MSDPSGGSSPGGAGEGGASVTAVILNYDGRELLEVILPSLAAQTYASFDALVVDNGSRDSSTAYVREQWPDVRVVEIPENVGVAAALNRGVAAASGAYVALLNNDVELDPRWLAELVSALERHPRAGTAAGKLLNFRSRDLIDAAGDVFTIGATAWGRGAGEVDRGQYDREEEVFAPTAGAALYRASALAEVGAFDESFYAYFEDVDWGLRAQLLGYRSVYVPSALGYHMGSQTTGGDVDPLYYRLQRRNILGVMIKDVPARFLLRHLPVIIAEQLLSLAYSVRARRLRVHLQALAAALCAAPGWLRARREIMRSRRIEPREFERFVSRRRG